jgi:hypothetical protein
VISDETNEAKRLHVLPCTHSVTAGRLNRAAAIVVPSSCRKRTEYTCERCMDEYSNTDAILTATHLLQEHLTNLR